MAVIKVYSRINWLNKSESLTTPLGKTNLNKMDKAINLIDDEVVSMSAKIDEIDTTKANTDQLNNMVTDVSFNDKNGVISITKHNGTVLNIDTAMEKIAVNFEYNAQTQQLILTLENGEKQYIDMSALITQYEFKDTYTIAFSIDSDGKVSASIKSGSITKAMLSSEVMSAITLSENNAAASAQAAAQSATNADMDAKLSQSYSVGKSGIRDGEETDNSKYYSEQAKKYADKAQEIAGGNFIPNSEKGIAGGVAVLNANLAVAKAVADEDGNNIQNTYATQQQVPTLVKVDGKTITKDKDGTLRGAMSIEVDSELSTTSMNPVQNKVITQALQKKADKSETTVNLLNSTLQTTTQDGITCTNNRDGSFTFTGISTANTYFAFDLNKYLSKGKYNLIGEKKDGTNLYITKENDFSFVAYSGIIEVKDSTYYRAVLEIHEGITLDSFVLHPMLTTNLSATIDDFVPYTGDTGSLNGDVAELQDSKADKTEVPKLVKVDGTTVFLSEDGVLSAKGGGSSFAPKEVTNASITNGNGKVTITWTDPNDVTLEGVTLSTWAGTKLVMNESNYPTNENDGTVVLNSTTRNQYQNTGYTVTGLTNNKTYYFALFPYSTDGIYNYSEAGRLLGKPSLVKLDPCTNIKATATMGKVTVTWTDPAATKTVDGNTATWKKTILVYKQGTSAPTDVNDGTIAVEETTRNQYQSTGYEVTSLIDGNDYSFSLFAISTDSAVSDATSVSAKLYATLTVTTEEASLYSKAVTVTSGSQKVTGTFSNSGSVTLRIPWIGNTTMSATDGTDTTTATVNIAEYGKSYKAELSFFKIVTFADGTDEEIAKMIQAHYNDKINIADYWAVGDKRKVNLSAMSATGVRESHRAQTVEFAIADFDHDDLTTAINGHTKAAVTLTQKDCLMDVTNSSSNADGSTNTENGSMNGININAGGWRNSNRRIWCNKVYFNALPSTWQNIVKTVNKISGIGNGSSSEIERTTDNIFLPAETEVFSGRISSISGEGVQYQYYKNAAANRYKLPHWTASGSYSTFWWCRSPANGNAHNFCCVSSQGNSNTRSADFQCGIAPCLCI